MKTHDEPFHNLSRYQFHAAELRKRVRVHEGGAWMEITVAVGSRIQHGEETSGSTEKGNAPR